MTNSRAKASGSAVSIDLKQLLMVAGNRLVERGYDPASTGADGDRTTTPIQRFTEWVNRCPEVQDVLRELNMSWPTSDDSKRTFSILLNGESVEVLPLSCIGDKLAVRSVTSERIVTLVIGEKNVHAEQRQRFRECLRAFGCPVHLIQLAETTGEIQDAGGN